MTGKTKNTLQQMATLFRDYADGCESEACSQCTIWGACDDGLVPSKMADTIEAALAEEAPHYDGATWERMLYPGGVYSTGHFCRNCGKEAPIDPFSGDTELLSDYCPWCGSMMRDLG